MRNGHTTLGGSTAFAFCMTAVITFLGKFASSFCTYLRCHFTHTTKKNNEKDIV